MSSPPRIRVAGQIRRGRAVRGIRVSAAVETSVSRTSEAPVEVAEPVPDVVARVGNHTLAIHQPVVAVVVRVALVRIMEVDGLCRGRGRRGEQGAAGERYHGGFAKRRERNPATICR